WSQLCHMSGALYGQCSEGNRRLTPESAARWERPRRGAFKPYHPAVMTDPQPLPRLLKIYRVAEKVPLGRRLFSQFFRRLAPYFRTTPAEVESADPGLVRVTMRDTRAIRNHLGTVHAIAMCNLAELAMGVAAEVTVPVTHRWIPKGMR